MKFDDKQYIAEQIRIHRKKAGLTQAELAEKVDLSVQHVSRIESGCYFPSLKSFFMIVSVLKIDLRIFGFDISDTEDSTKNKLIGNIMQASKTELLFYENMIYAINQSVNKVRNELW